MFWTICLLLSMTTARVSLAVAEKRATQPRPTLKSAGETLEVAIIAVCIVFLVVRPLMLQAFFIPSLSMAPTLQVDDRILVNKLSYRLGLPSRNEIVVFKAPSEATQDDPDTEERDFVKRVVGLPGDTVEIHSGVTLVNGEALKEPFAHERPDYDMPPYVVPKDKLFVMGDNRNHSNDSHRWGALDRSLLIGRAVLIFWPPSRAGAIR